MARVRERTIPIERPPLILSSYQNVVRICGQIPVFRGAADSIVETFQRAENIHGSDGFGDFHYRDAPDVEEIIQNEHAVNYLTCITAQNPGKTFSVHSGGH
jgi:inosine-uridine nucleoside N-ribohydrolase